MKRHLIFISTVVAFAAAFALSKLDAQDPTTAAAINGKLVPGLVLSFQNAKGETIDAREARLIALMVPAGSPASPMMEPGPWSATWSGIANTKIKDTYRFAAEGRGDLNVILNDKPILELHGDLANHPTDEIQLKKGKNRLVVKYKSPPDGDASIRLLWAASGKTLEPISPAFFTHDSANESLVKFASARAGRELVATMRCAACHQGIDGSIPELKQDAPSLADLKNRLNATWVAYWITNPRAIRPTADMPRLYHDVPAASALSVDDRAGDIAAYLTTADAAVTPVIDPQILAHGARLFTGLGCVACHLAPGVEDSDTSLNRVPLKYVRSKFKSGALVDFLHKPEGHFAWIKMPNFRLSDAEASALASWLTASCPADALPPIAKQFDAENGKKLFETSGCLNCHATDHSQPAAPGASALTAATEGCLAEPVQKGVDFGFTAGQRESIRSFISTDWKPALQRDPLPEFTARQLSSLRCTACHSTDGRDNIWTNLDTEITAIEQNLPPRPKDDPEPKGDQTRPPLTWTGEKLQPEWMSAFIAGKINYKPRQWLFARMPAFASRAEVLTRGLALSHGMPATNETRQPVDEKLADIGKQLIAQTGLGCVKCHAVADQAALSPFEAEAPNFAHIDARLRHGYYNHWMRNPQYYLPGTKMPSFADVNGQTAFKDVLNGDAAAEYEAIWNYLRAGEKIVPVQ